MLKLLSRKPVSDTNVQLVSLTGFYAYLSLIAAEKRLPSKETH